MHIATERTFLRRENEKRKSLGVQVLCCGKKKKKKREVSAKREI